MKRTVLKARLAGAVGLASISMIALAACGGGGEVTTGGGDETTTEASSEAATTDAATSDAATSDAATTDAATTEAAAGIQPATEADIEPAKQVIVDFYDKAASGDFAGACGLVLDPTTHVGLGAGSVFTNACVQGLEGQKDTFSQFKGLITADMVSATVEPDGRLAITLGGQPTALKAAKGADGNIYIDMLGSQG